MFSKIIKSAGIGRKLIIYIFLFSSVVTFLGTALQLYLDYTRDIKSIQDTMSQIESSYLQSISSSLWYIDEEQVIIVLNGILRLPNMQHLEIRQKGELFISVGQPQQDNIIQQEFQLSYKFKGQDKILGVLKATASLTGIYKRLWSRIAVILSTQAVKTFLVSAFIFYLFYILVGRHLIFMADYAKRLDLKLLHTPLDLKRKPPKDSDELETLVQSINIMRKNIADDLIARNLAEQELRLQSEIITRMSEGVYLIRMDDGTIVYTNPEFEKMFGYDPGEMIGKHVSIVNYPTEKNPEETAREIMAIINKEGVWQGEIQNIKKDGKLFWCLASVSVFDHMKHGKVVVSVHTDITDRKHAEEKIKASLEEKEVLLSEIHHRVKNNMQVIISLFRLRADKIEDKKYADMFKEGEDRIRSMALIHEQLYQTKDFANINFGEYIKSLANGLFISHGVDTNKIKLNIDIKDVSFDIENAIPCGLIINELVSNSLKHAFPQQREGNISIILQSTNEDGFGLTVSDNGVGIPEDLDIRDAESMGLQLVRILAEQTLEGKMELKRKEGTQFHFLLKRVAYKPRI